MKKISGSEDKKSSKIDEVGITEDVLTSRGGMTLFVRYLGSIGILTYLGKLFGFIRKSRKGLPVAEMFKQIFCFLMDGTSRHLVYFDTLSKDKGYAAGIETAEADLVSSHGVKRFFKSFLFPMSWIFRKVLLKLFIWRLKIVKPDLIVIGLDSMVMDNDEALKRQGVKPTYKKKKGFQPLQMTWGRFIIDAIFRSGNRHCNYGDDTVKMIGRMIKAIADQYSADVPVVICMDSGFFDQKIFEFCEKLHIGYICGGKIYNQIKMFVNSCDKGSLGRYEQPGQVWEYLEFGNKRDSWNRFRRTVYCRPLCQDKQMTFTFARPDTVIYTNIGADAELDSKLKRGEGVSLLEVQGIIKAYHDRGADELVHRALKDFGFEELPFLRFHQNAAFYYTMLIGFFLFESFKADVCTNVVPVVSYAATVRRRLIDIAAKIVRHSGKVVLKISQAAFDGLLFDHLWKMSVNPPAVIK